MTGRRLPSFAIEAEVAKRRAKRMAKTMKAKAGFDRARSRKFLHEAPKVRLQTVAPVGLKSWDETYQGPGWQTN